MSDISNPESPKSTKGQTSSRDQGSARSNVEQSVVTVPELHFHETYKAVDIPITQEKIIYEPKEVIKEREIHVVKPIIKEKIVEVPTYKFVEKVVEVPQVVFDEKIVEVEKIEKISKTSQPTSPKDTKQLEIETQYRQVPKPIEVPVAFYSAVPKPVFIDRAVPIPMELQIVQEILIPRIEPVYKDIPIPVHVKRTIEKPVPIGLYEHPDLLQNYLQDPDEPLPTNPNLYGSFSTRSMNPQSTFLGQSMNSRQALNINPQSFGTNIQENAPSN